MEKIAFQLAWLGEHKVLIFLFFAELLVAACLLIVFLHLRLSWRRLNFNKSDDKGSLNGFDLVDDPCFLLRSSDLFPLYVTKDFERQLGLTKEHFKNDVLCLSPKLPEEQAKRLRKEYNAWDGKRPILMDIEPLGMDACYRLSVTRKDGMDLFHFRDITEEKRQLDEMRADLEAAENVSQSKSAYLSEMSHEIRTPLNGIIGMLNLAHRQLHGHSTEDYIVKAEQLSEFLLTVINEVLDMSRIEVGKIELENKPFDLYHLADQIRNLFKKTIEEKGITYIVEMKDVDVRYVVGDEERISQILVNLLSNASKFTEKGEIRVTFRQMMRNKDSVEFLFRVHDTGKGMDPKFIKRIFHPFEQENAGITKQYGGSGLGMAITDKLIQLMGGSILVDSYERDNPEDSGYQMPEDGNIETDLKNASNLLVSPETSDMPSGGNLPQGVGKSAAVIAGTSNNSSDQSVIKLPSGSGAFSENGTSGWDDSNDDDASGSGASGRYPGGNTSGGGGSGGGGDTNSG